MRQIQLVTPEETKIISQADAVRLATTASRCWFACNVTDLAYGDRDELDLGDGIKLRSVLTRDEDRYM